MQKMENIRNTTVGERYFQLVGQVSIVKSTIERWRSTTDARYDAATI